MISKAPINKGSQKAQKITNPPPKHLYDLKSAAEYLGRSVWGVRELVWSNKLPVVRDGTKQYVNLYDMDHYIERNKITVI